MCRRVGRQQQVRHPGVFDPAIGRGGARCIFGSGFSFSVLAGPLRRSLFGKQVMHYVHVLRMDDMAFLQGRVLQVKPAGRRLAAEKLEVRIQSWKGGHFRKGGLRSCVIGWVEADRPLRDVERWFGSFLLRANGPTQARLCRGHTK